MIVPIKGNVTYSITMDPTVWIFDDRKVLLEEAFTKKPNESDKVNEFDKTAQRWSQEVYQQKIKPPVNKSINRFEKEKILKNSYVMPINDFIEHAELKSDAKEATLVTDQGDVNISLDDLKNCFLLFSVDGKPLKEDGPVHLFYQDGSNKDKPITGIKEIIIN